MNNKLLIFDFDGTIADTFELAQKILNEIRHKYHLPEAIGADFVKDIQDINVFDALRKFGFSEESINEFLLFIKDAYEKEDIEPFPDIIDVVKNLHDDGATLAIVSSNHTDSVESFLKKYSLKEMFSYVLGGDVNTSKVQNIEYIIKETNTPLNNIYFIGDTTGDITEAKEAHVKTIGVTWGFHDEERLLEASPERIIQKPEDLLTI